MKRNKVFSIIRQQRVSSGTLGYFYKNGMGSKNSILHFLLSKTTLMESVSRQQWLGCCPLKSWFFPLLGRRLLTHLMFDQPTSLNELGYFICCMACKQKPVSRLYLVGKPHECQGIATKSERHPPTDNLWRLFHVIDGSNWETPVSYWAPKVRTHEVVPEVLTPDIVRGFPNQRASHCKVDPRLLLRLTLQPFPGAQ